MIVWKNLNLKFEGVAEVVDVGEMKRKNERRKLPLGRVSNRDREMAVL